MERRSIRLSIDSQLDDVFLVGLAANKICSYFAMSEVEAYRVEVCVVEAVNNCVKHAYSGETGHEVVVEISVSQDRVDIEIRDRGKPLVRSSQEAPRLQFDPDDRETLPEGGMGLFIIHDIMDEVAYESRGGENVLSMCWKFERVARESVKGG